MWQAWSPLDRLLQKHAPYQHVKQQLKIVTTYAQHSPAVVLVQLIYQPLNVVEAANVIDAKMRFAHVHMLWWQLCHLHEPSM